jgi:hypothetical protein
METAIKVLKNGNLELSISEVSFADYRELLDNKEKYYGIHAITEVFEYHFCNSDYAVVPDNVPIGLTEAPAISDYDFWNEEDEKKVEFMNEMGFNIWYYDMYMIHNPFEVLLREKKVVFTLAQQ